MSLKSTILAAVQKIRNALGDLIVVGTLVRRTKQSYVPGSPVKYDEVSYSISLAINKQADQEEEGERVDDDTIEMYIFPTSVIPQSNDVVSFNGLQYRIIGNKPIYAGNEIALSVVQVRPGGQV